MQRAKVKITYYLAKKPTEPSSTANNKKKSLKKPFSNQDNTN